MKTIIHLELDDTQLNSMARLFDGKESKRTATRKEISVFVEGCFECALGLTHEDNPTGEVSSAGELVIEDINRGGWSFIGQEIAE